jgi:hypothetical protein
MLDGLRFMLLPTMIVPGCIDMLRFLVKMEEEDKTLSSRRTRMDGLRFTLLASVMVSALMCCGSSYKN